MGFRLVDLDVFPPLPGLPKRDGVAVVRIYTGLA